MSEEILMHTANDIGPEAMIYVYDPVVKMKGLLVIDSMAGGPAGGGTRMLSDITADEIFGLARAMTNKFAILGLPRGGCKAGIWCDPLIEKEKKKEIMRSFGRALKPYLESRVVTLATDMGVSIEDLDMIYDGVGIKPAGKSLLAEEKDGETLGSHFTGYGVVIAMKAACEVAGVDMSKARLAIEGFGKVGGGVLRYAKKEGVKIVAISTIHEAVYDERGLDVEKLFELRHKYGDICLAQYNDAQHIAAKDLYYLPVEILVPGARPYVLSKDNIGGIQAKIISSGANIPATLEAERIFFERGIVSVPDFIANSGGTISATVNYMEGSAELAFKTIEKLVSKLTKAILQEALENNIDPYRIALEKCRKWVFEKRKEGKKLTFDQTIERIKERSFDLW
jgi:glutamate dehydrogenase (NAD(P)+)